MRRIYYIGYFLVMFIIISSISCGGLVLDANSLGRADDGQSDGGAGLSDTGGEDDGDEYPGLGAIDGNHVRVSGKFSGVLEGVVGFPFSMRLPEENSGLFAISDEGTITKAAPDNRGGFYFDLERDGINIFVFVVDNDIRTFKAGVGGHDIDSFALRYAGSEIDLGTLTMTDENFISDRPVSEFLNQLGFDDDEAYTLGVLDNALTRFANMDIDGNGIFDFMEGKKFWFSIDYEFGRHAYLNDIINSWGEADDVEYKGYMYYFSLPDDGPALSSNSAMTPPSYIVTSAQELFGPDEPMPSCYTEGGQDHRIYNYLCVGQGAFPSRPPEGTYLIKADDDTYTLRGIRSRLMEGTKDVFVPVPYLKVDDGIVTEIDWRWMRYDDASDAWISATPRQLDLVFGNLGSYGYEFALENDIRVIGTLNMVPEGSVVLSEPVAIEDVKYFRVHYQDFTGYSYGFEWK